MTASNVSGTPGVGDADLALYLEALLRGQRREAIDVAGALLLKGVSAERVVTDLLSKA